MTKLKIKKSIFMVQYHILQRIGHVVASLDRAATDGHAAASLDFTLFGGFEQAANLHGKKSNVSRKTWKMVNF